MNGLMMGGWMRNIVFSSWVFDFWNVLIIFRVCVCWWLVVEVLWILYCNLEYLFCWFVCIVFWKWSYGGFLFWFLCGFFVSFFVLVFLENGGYVILFGEFCFSFSLWVRFMFIFVFVFFWKVVYVICV